MCAGWMSGVLKFISRNPLFVFPLLLFFLFVPVEAQEKLVFSVVSFEEDYYSITAQDKRFERIDADGNRYAIIKVKCADDGCDLNGLRFDFGALNSSVEKHDDELWVYVQRNAKTVTIKCHGYKPIEKYNLNTTIKPGATYKMVVTMNRIRSFIERDITKQVLQFVVTPSKENAVVKVKKAGSSSDYELWGAVDEKGSIDKLLEFGTYDYVVSAKDYESSEGRVVLSNSKETYVERISLKPDFGFLCVDGQNGATGAQLFVDDEMVGTIPYKSTDKRWRSGEHRLTVKKGELYKTYTSIFVIEKGDTARLSPKVEADFAETTIRVGEEAEILIDGKSVGKSEWVGPLKAGRYVVECRKVGYRPSSRAINVKANKSETFEMPVPIAITGSVYVSSTPSDAEIRVDGNNCGTTPKLIPHVLIGEHEITLLLKNHKTEQRMVAIKEGETENLNVALSDIADMTIVSNPPHAELSIDGVAVGYTPFRREMASGSYELELSHRKYEMYKKRIHLDSSSPSVVINLRKQYQRRNSFYVQPFVDIRSNMAIGGSLGGYIANVNLEGHYAVSTKESEMIYWNTKSVDGKTCGYTYKASYIGGNVGYGFIMNRRMRITPQVGFEIVNLTSAEEYNVSADFDASKANVVDATVGIKFEYAFANNIGIFLAPAYSFALKKSDYYSDMERVSSIIKGYASSFSLRTGITIFF